MTLVSGGTTADDYEPEQGRPGDRGGAFPLLQRDLSVRTEQSANRCVLSLGGRLSCDTVGTFDRHVDRLGCRWCNEVVVDLSGLTVLDLVGARVLVGLSHYVAGRGGRFLIEGSSPFMDSMLETAGVELAN